MFVSSVIHKNNIENCLLFLKKSPKWIAVLRENHENRESKSLYITV